MGGRGIGARRPPVAVQASVPKCTSRVSRIYVPAAHYLNESGIPLRGNEESRFRSSIFSALDRNLARCQTSFFLLEFKGELHDLFSRSASERRSELKLLLVPMDAYPRILFYHSKPK